MGFPGSSADKESACNAGDLDLIPGLERSPGGGHDNPLQYSWAFLVAQLVKKSACNVGDLDLILRLEIYPGEGKGYLLQYSGLENSMGFHGVAKSWTPQSDFHSPFPFSLALYFSSFFSYL